MDLLDFIPHFVSDRVYVSRPFAVGTERSERVFEVGEEVRKGYAAAWASRSEEVGIHRVDGGRGSGRKGVEDVGVFDGVGCD